MPLPGRRFLRAAHSFCLSPRLAAPFPGPTLPHLFGHRHLRSARCRGRPSAALLRAMPVRVGPPLCAVKRQLQLACPPPSASLPALLALPAPPDPSEAQAGTLPPWPRHPACPQLQEGGDGGSQPGRRDEWAPAFPSASRSGPHGVTSLPSVHLEPVPAAPLTVPLCVPRVGCRRLDLGPDLCAGAGVVERTRWPPWPSAENKPGPGRGRWGSGPEPHGRSADTTLPSLPELPRRTLPVHADRVPGV